MSNYFNKPFNQAATQTVDFTSGMTAVQIQALIDKLPKFIPYGVTVDLDNADGSYTSLGGSITIAGFYGGGTLNINGNLTDSSSRHDTQSVHWDFTGDACSGIILENNSCLINITQMKVTTDDGYDSVSCTAGSLSGRVSLCSVKSVAKTSGVTRSIYLNDAYIKVVKTNVSNSHIGIYAVNNSKAVSNDVGTTGTIPNYGLRADTNGVIGKVSTQPTGATSAELANNGGAIR